MNVPDTMGNVQTSKNIQLASGVNFTKINDELKRRANTLADILKNEYGMTLVISSGYRTKAQQAALLRKGTGYMTAQPGRSRHQYGKAFDVAINSHMKPQFYKSKKAMQQYGGNFNAFWADMTRRAGLYRFSPNGDPPHHTLPPGTQYGGSSRRMTNPQYATAIRTGNNISMSPNITVDKGVRWDGLHSYMKELLNYFGDNMMRKYGIKPHFRHMHRTKADQQPHYDAYRSGRGGIAARPGNSFHQAGLAADLDWPRIQAFFNKRADLKKAYNNNFWRFIDDELRQVGLHRSLGMRDRPHIQPIENDRYYARVNHNALMSSRGTWDMGGAPFELHQPHVRGGRLNIGYMRQPVSYQFSGGSIWGAPEGAQARAIAYGGKKARQIKGWGQGAGYAQPHNFSSSPLFMQFVNRSAKETGANPQHIATFLNFILNTSAMGETKLGSAQIGKADKADKGTFGIRDITFNGLKTGIKRYGRGLDPGFLNKFLRARDVYDMTTEEQAILALMSAGSAERAYKEKVRKGAAAVASGNINAIRDAMVDYISTLHWAGGNIPLAIKQIHATITRMAARGKYPYRVSTGQQFFSQRLIPHYTQQVNDFLNYITRRR